MSEDADDGSSDPDDAADGETDAENAADGETDAENAEDGGRGRDGTDDTGGGGREPFRPELDEVRRDLGDVADDLEALEERIEERTVDRDDLEDDLERYVRRRMRRGHARGWGPYLVLLYGTAMTLGAFYFLGGGWAVLAMIVIWLSTLGLYTLMLLVGLGLNLLGGVGRLRDVAGSVVGKVR